MFGNETGLLLASGMFFDNTFEIRFNRPPRNLSKNPDDLICVFNF
jgi:hypothetical protein